MASVTSTHTLTIELALDVTTLEERQREKAAQALLNAIRHKVNAMLLPNFLNTYYRSENASETEQYTLEGGITLDLTATES